MVTSVHIWVEFLTENKSSSFIQRTNVFPTSVSVSQNENSLLFITKYKTDNFSPSEYWQELNLQSTCKSEDHAEYHFPICWIQKILSNSQTLDTFIMENTPNNRWNVAQFGEMVSFLSVLFQL